LTSFRTPGSLRAMPVRQFDEWAVLLRPEDDVAVLKRPLKTGDELMNGSLVLKAPSLIPAGHKIALRPIADGQPVRKYGQTIGFAQDAIQPGEHVHTHNLVMRDFGREYAFCADARPVSSAALTSGHSEVITLK